MAKSTLAPILWPLMELEDITPGFCAICGRQFPTEKHHIVRRSAGELLDENGKKVPKPLIQLCGFGNNLKDADGRYFCHGLAHANMLHFRNTGGRLEYLITAEPCKYQEALQMQGWKQRGWF